MRDTKPNLSNNKFEQCVTDIMTLSGCTEVHGILEVENGGILQIQPDGTIDSSGSTGYEISGTSFLRAGVDTSSIELGKNACVYASDSSIAIGLNSIASGSTTIAIGEDSHAEANNMVVIGESAAGGTTSVFGANSISIGSKSNYNGSIGTGSVSIGYGAKSCGSDSMAIGQLASVSGTGLAIGRGACTISGTVIGRLACAVQGDIAIGYAANAAGVSSVSIGRAANADLSFGVALGWQSCASGASSIAIGGAANAEATSSIAIGSNSCANLLGHGIAIGAAAISSACASVALGNSACASGVHSVAIGIFSKALTNCALAIGRGALSDGNCSVSFGASSNAGGTASLAMGFFSNSCGFSAIALGSASEAGGGASVAIGRNADACGGYSVGIGGKSYSRITGSISVGGCSHALGVNSIAVGWRSVATGSSAQALGTCTYATGINSVAIGNYSCSKGTSTISIGNKSNSELTNGIAIGYCSSSLNHFDLALGKGACVNSFNGVGVGVDVIVTGSSSTAIGGSSIAGGARSIAIGHGADTFGNCNAVIGFDVRNDIPNSVGFGWHNAGDDANITILFGQDKDSYLSGSSAQLAIGHDTPTAKIDLLDSTACGAFRMRDGSETVGYVLTSDADGYGTWEASSGGGSTASGENIQKEINQSSHGFAVEDVVAYSGGTYIKAIADGTVDGETFGIVTSADTNNFVVTFAGYISGLTLTSNTTYFVSDVTAGLLTATEPIIDGHISKPILATTIASEGLVLPYRGSFISTGDTYVTGSVNVGVGTGIATGFTGSDLAFKSLSGGTSIVLIDDGDTITISGGSSSGGINVGVGNGIYTGKTGVDLRFKSLSGGTGIVLLDDGDTITISGGSSSGDFLRADIADVKTAGELRFNDNVCATFGADDDLRIYHNGSHSYIQNNGTGNLILRPTATDSGVFIEKDGCVGLFYNNSQKFKTLVDGACTIGQHSVEGTLNILNGPAGNTHFGHLGTHNYISHSCTGSTYFRTHSVGTTYKTNSCIDCNGNYVSVDGISSYFGSGCDLRITHTGFGGCIVNCTGTFIIRATSIDAGISVKPDSCVTLYYNGSARLDTESWGTCTTGTHCASTMLRAPIVCATNFCATGIGVRYCAGTGCGRAVLWTQTSDCRCKKCIESYECGLDKVNELNPVYYQWKHDNREDIGFIAQDVLEVEPKLVMGSDEEGYGLNYSNITVLTVKAIQELSCEVKVLREEVNELKNK